MSSWLCNSARKSSKLVDQKVSKHCWPVIFNLRRKHLNLPFIDTKKSGHDADEAQNHRRHLRRSNVLLQKTCKVLPRWRHWWDLKFASQMQRLNESTAVKMLSRNSLGFLYSCWFLFFHWAVLSRWFVLIWILVKWSSRRESWGLYGFFNLIPKFG